MPPRISTSIVFVAQAEPFGKEPSLLHLADLSLERNHCFKQLTNLLPMHLRPSSCLALGCRSSRGCRLPNRQNASCSARLGIVMRLHSFYNSHSFPLRYDFHLRGNDANSISQCMSYSASRSKFGTSDWAS